MPEASLGVIGGGVMGEALLSRLLDRGIFSPQAIWVSDPQATRRQSLQASYGVHTTASNAEVIQQAQTILLAIKPQALAAVAQDFTDLSHSTTAPPLGLSILAGVTLSRLAAACPGWVWVRAMPNTPATVGAGITALAAGPGVTADQLHQARTIFACVGEVIEVPETLMDAVTALSGSGPGYLAVVIEALADGGVAAGLPRAIALQLALQTVKGTAELLQQTDWHPAVLKDRVTSPGGTTIAGIAQLEAAGLRSALIEAVRTAHRRSMELGQL
ncbi:MAG TPA: pyrroline-5-carboxylate reductase [Leptolyngbyaceae cyanobacterium M65_K2018_010]|nr:pyrroline-5-carboxylate reductase [Leptolyngbyaceae cyanobacterium M65_K2018_010]